MLACVCSSCLPRSPHPPPPVSSRHPDGRIYLQPAPDLLPDSTLGVMFELFCSQELQQLQSQSPGSGKTSFLTAVVNVHSQSDRRGKVSTVESSNKSPAVLAKEFKCFISEVNNGLLCCCCCLTASCTFQPGRR